MLLPFKPLKSNKCISITVVKINYSTSQLRSAIKLLNIKIRFDMEHHL